MLFAYFNFLCTNCKMLLIKVGAGCVTYLEWIVCESVVLLLYCLAAVNSLKNCVLIPHLIYIFNLLGDRFYGGGLSGMGNAEFVHRAALIFVCLFVMMFHEMLN